MALRSCELHARNDDDDYAYYKKGEEETFLGLFAECILKFISNFPAHRQMDRHLRQMHNLVGCNKCKLNFRVLVLF